MTKERFLELCEVCFLSKEDYLKDINKLLNSGCIGLDSFTDATFLDIYPVVAAVYERHTKWFIEGSLNKEWKRKARKTANNYKCYI